MLKWTMFSFAIITGCSSVPYNYTPTNSSFSIPDINKTVSSGLGEPLLDQGISTTRDILLVIQPVNISLYKIKPGKFIKVGDDGSREFYNQDLTAGFSIYSGLISAPDATATLVRNKNKNDFCIIRPADLDVCGAIITESKKENVISTSSYRRTLIYSGRVGNKLKINYREFNNDMARSAFNTDVEYDLNESDIIGYSGARLQVINATNTQITYKVLKNFN